MANSLRQFFAVTRKEFIEARRDRFFALLVTFVTIAALLSLVTGSIALSSDIATYEAAKQTLLALGKQMGTIANPEFYPLKLLRGAVEQIEIIGAVIGILVGFRGALAERQKQTLALVVTRPVSPITFISGKVIAGFALISASLLAVFSALTLALTFTSGIQLTADDLVRIAWVWGLSSLYITTFFLLALGLTLYLRRPSSALLGSFILWLLLVLIAPQIGDTLDPDNQVAGGVFKQLHIPKAEQEQIKKGFAGYETLRNSIEAASVTKHFERASFAILGIKDTYTGKPLKPILAEKQSDLWWILLSMLAVLILTLTRPINFQTTNEELI